MSGSWDAMLAHEAEERRSMLELRRALSRLTKADLIEKCILSAADALAYVDKSLDNVADLDPDTVWTNAEVVEVLEDIRSLMLTGEPLPGLFTLAPDREDRSTDG